MIKTTSKKKKCKKATWLSDEALQIAEKRTEAKAKGKERYTHLNAQFQRIARRYKKAFHSDQCKELEENNRMWKARVIFKKTQVEKNKIKLKKKENTSGPFQTKMGTRKERNTKDLTEAENVKNRLQEHIELYKKDLPDLDNHDSVIIHLEPDILECEVKWALRKHHCK